jgi:hypothetical protein
MSKFKRSQVVGFHNIKNKVSRNAFDLSHRHLFTAQIGELLPVFYQWVNPNETFKLGFNSLTRTQPLETAAFTRLHENIQYYFVPFQSLWKFFEQQVNNMTSGQSGENISRIAKSSSEDSVITTSMPYLNYDYLRSILNNLMNDTTDAVILGYKAGNTTPAALSSYLSNTIFMVNGRLRYVNFVRLLRSFGLFNSNLDGYDIIDSLISFVNSSTSSSWNKQDFLNSSYGWWCSSYSLGSSKGYFEVNHAPNLSIFPLLAYQKIYYDHYIYRQWQPYRSYACNIDYLLPSDSMNFSAKLSSKGYDAALFDLHSSNLPLDYFNGVLPRAQYGDESAATVSASSNSYDFSINNVKLSSSNNHLFPVNTVGPLAVKPDSTNQIGPSHNGTMVLSNDQSVNISKLSGTSDSSLSGSLKISALRSAIALQKYKEIQESNDPDFASQVLAHFGVKPKHDDYKSVFIGGSDNILDINPQVNQNLSDDNTADIKATASGTLSASCSFTSDTFGIIIGVYRCIPQLDVAHCGLDRNNFKTDASDFPLPELDNLGMQTQYRSEVFAPIAGDVKPNLGSSHPSVDMSRTYGYLPRFAELKTSYDRYDGAFLYSLNSWVTGYTSSVLSKWAFAFRSDSPSSYKNIDELLICPPSITDSIFVDQFSLTSNNDKLLVGSVNSCVAVRPYSVYGLPYSK